MIKTPVVDLPQRGEMRVVTRFLLFPTCLNGVWRWGFARVRQEFVVWVDYDGDWWAWVDREFVEASRERVV